MIKNIVFDCSDTLLRFSDLDALTEVTGDASLAKKIKTTIHQSQAWDLYDKGLISKEGLRKEVLQLFDESHKPFAAWYLDNWLKCYAPIPGMYEIVSDLKEKGWPLYILSDFPMCFEDLKSRFPDLFSLFTGLAVSYECHATKRDMGLFAYLQNKFSLEPHECLFVDDVPLLIKNAQSLGFHGIVLENAQRLREQLKQLNVL